MPGPFSAHAPPAGMGAGRERAAAALRQGRTLPRRLRGAAASRPGSEAPAFPAAVATTLLSIRSRMGLSYYALGPPGGTPRFSGISARGAPSGNTLRLRTHPVYGRKMFSGKKWPVKRNTFGEKETINSFPPNLFFLTAHFFPESVFRP